MENQKLHSSPETINETLKGMKDGTVDLGVGIKTIIFDLIVDARENVDHLQDIYNTLDLGKELDDTQQAWLDAFVKQA